MREYFAYNMDAAGKEKTLKTLLGFNPLQFPQWTVIDLPDLYDGFFG